VTLEVRVSNLAAQQLYQQHGFKIIVTKKHYYENGEDAYLMEKTL
jgi:ribosomal-protein-alanine N-acetyltransferase